MGCLEFSVSLNLADRGATVVAAIYNIIMPPGYSSGIPGSDPTGFGQLGRLNVAATILSYINVEMTWNEWYGLDRHVACADNHQLLRYVVVLFLFSHSGLSHSVLL